MVHGNGWRKPAQKRDQKTKLRVKKTKMLIRKKSGGLVEVNPGAVQKSEPVRYSSFEKKSSHTSWPNKNEQRQSAAVAESAAVVGQTQPVNLAIAIINRQVMLIDAAAPGGPSPETSFILTRITDDYDVAFIPLAAPCAQCGGREFWVPRKAAGAATTANRGLAGANMGARHSGHVRPLHCLTCRPVKVEALVLGRVTAILVADEWAWDKAIEDELRRRWNDRQGNSEGHRGAARDSAVKAGRTSQPRPWWDWPEYDGAMGYRVIEDRGKQLSLT